MLRRRCEKPSEHRADYPLSGAGVFERIKTPAVLVVPLVSHEGRLVKLQVTSLTEATKEYVKFAPTGAEPNEHTVSELQSPIAKSSGNPPTTLSFRTAVSTILFLSTTVTVAR